MFDTRNMSCYCRWPWREGPGQSHILYQEQPGTQDLGCSGSDNSLALFNFIAESHYCI